MKKDSTLKRGRGRPLAFDPDQAIDAAMRVFWLKGYEGAALSDLTEAMGINNPSLYAKFADKRGLFLAALDHYQATIAARHMEPLVTQTTIRAAIAGHFASINAALDATGTPPGCLIGAVATDMAGRDEEIRARVDALVSTAEDFLTQRFTQMGGAPMDECVLAELVVSVGQSLASRSRAGARGEELNAMTGRLLMALFGPEEPVPRS